ncbi:MAG: hypothetical protein KAH01_02230 [Caldisericia bacterium]|nr:hypothetical protein [Caldisericia bacterium]
MTEKTITSWLSIHPIEIRQRFKLPLSKGQELIKKALDSKGKKPLELILRSIYDNDDFIAQRFYYLQNYAKSNEEKILCLQNNIQDITAMDKEQKEKGNVEQQYRSFVLYLHILHLSEVFWTIPEKRNNAETFWGVYQKSDYFKEAFDLQSVLLYRYPLMQTQEFDIDLLLSPTDDIALHTYAKALYFFSKNPSSEEAQSLLNKSLELNPHVPSLLLQKKRIPKKSPMKFEPGQISEANYIAYLAGESWWSVEDAISWLRNSSS